jgi:hypothetical protein
VEPSQGSTQDFPPGFRIERDNWEVPVAPGERINLENLHGDVRLRRNGIPRLDVFVVIQLQEQDPLGADVQIIDTDEGLAVDVRYVAKEQEREAGDPPAEPTDFIRRVDMVVYVPSGSPVHVRTDDDLIEARETKSDIIAESTSGDLTIVTAGAVRARTESGSILTVMLSDEPGRSSVFETDTGDITVQVPDDLDIRLRAKTAGRITSEYPPVEADTEGPGIHETVVQVGTGVHEAQVDSRTGDIDIRAWRRSGPGRGGR